MPWTVWDEVAKWEHDIRTQIKGFECDSCKKPRCCYQLVLTAPWEAEEIATFLKGKGRVDPALRAELTRVGQAQLVAGRQAWWARHKACIFLQGRRCSIYDVRPMSCRVVLAVKCLDGSLMKAVSTEELYHHLESSSGQLVEEWGLEPLPMAVNKALGD